MPPPPPTWSLTSSFLNSTGTAPGFSNVLDFFRGLQGSQDRQGNQYLGLSRIDWNVTASNQVSTTVNILRWDSPNGIQTAPTHQFHSSANGSDVVKNETVITRWNSISGQNFVSELRFQWGRDFEAQQPNAGGAYVQVTNGIIFGMPDFLPRAAYPNERRWQASANLSWLHGRHSVQWGFDNSSVRDKIINLFQGGGVYTYSLLNDLALDCSNPALPLGNCLSAATGANQGKHYLRFNQQFDSLGQGGGTVFSNADYAFYVEDTYKPVPTLTLNLGVRYELESMPSPSGNSAVPATARINTDYNNFGPRVGFAWDPFGKHKTVIRGGAGMYYGRTQNSTLFSFLTSDGLRFQGFQFLPGTAGAPVFPQVFSGIPQGTAGRPDVLFASPDFTNPLIYQMQLSVEHELFENFTLSGVYMATRGQRMPLFRDTNLFASTQQATYSVCAVPQAGSSTACSQIERTVSVPFFPGPSTNRPIAAFGRITAAESVVNTWYHGFVLQAKHRFSKGFQMQASFTVSKTIDNDQISQTFFAANQPLNPFNVRDDYSLSNFDQRKRFTLSGYWVLPFSHIGNRPLRAALNGFQVSSILTLGDGRPYSGTISGNPSASYSFE